MSHKKDLTGQKFGRGKERSQFWEGMADAMAVQWGNAS